MGTCSYTLTKPCNISDDLPYFTVDTQNEHRGSNKKVSYVRAVLIHVNGVSVILGKGRTIQVSHLPRRFQLCYPTNKFFLNNNFWPLLLKQCWGHDSLLLHAFLELYVCLWHECVSVLQVNGTVVVPPVTSISGVKIYLSGKFVVLEASFGLRVRFDGNHHADVTIPTSYNSLLCGLCGKEDVHVKGTQWLWNSGYQRPKVPVLVVCCLLLFHVKETKKSSLLLIVTLIAQCWISVYVAGNFNGNPKDDNLKPDNTPAANTNEMGDSWQVPDPRPEWVTSLFHNHQPETICSYICCSETGFKGICSLIRDTITSSQVHNSHFHLHLFSSCTNGGGHEDCDDDVEEEAKKPTSCGMITDPNGIIYDIRYPFIVTTGNISLSYTPSNCTRHSPTCVVDLRHL